MSTRDHTDLIVNDVLVSIVVNRIEAVVLAGGFDALVSSDDAQLSMGGGVSGAILSVAGRTVAEEAKRLVPLKVGDVAVTSAGRLPAKYILHAVTVDSAEGIYPTERTVRVAAQNVFLRCELLGVTRLAMPALATGAGRFLSDHSARLIIGALAKHSGNPTALREVVFCLPEERERVAFLAYLNRVRGNAYTSEPGSWPTLGSSKDEAPDTSPVAAGAPRKIGRLAGFTDTIRGWLGRAHRDEVSTRTAPPPAAIRKETDEEKTLRSLRPDSRPLVSNRYVLLEELGRGGMGVVFLAWDIVLRQTLAIKTLQPETRLSSESQNALKREAALQIGLVHEGIVRLLNFEPWDPLVGPYILMEYLPWVSGERWVAEAGTSGLPAASVLAVGVRLCDALAYAHASNVLHGDIKPSNIFVDPAGDWAKLADFGIARVIGVRERNALVTKLMGTPDYMAPEQKAFGAKVGPRTDIYMLARTLAEFLGGRFDSEQRLELPHNALLRPVVPVLRQGMAGDPANRPADAREFARLLSGARTAIA